MKISSAENINYDDSMKWNYAMKKKCKYSLNNFTLSILSWGFSNSVEYVVTHAEHLLAPFPIMTVKARSSYVTLYLKLAFKHFTPHTLGLCFSYS